MAVKATSLFSVLNRQLAMTAGLKISSDDFRYLSPRHRDARRRAKSSAEPRRRGCRAELMTVISFGSDASAVICRAVTGALQEGRKRNTDDDGDAF